MKLSIIIDDTNKEKITTVSKEILSSYRHLVVLFSEKSSIHEFNNYKNIINY